MRNLIIHEQEDVLQVTRLLPAEWSQPGQRIAIRNAPTYFGHVSAEVEFDEVSETLRINAEWRKPPREIRWYLSGAGRRVVEPEEGARLDGQLVVVDPSVRHVRLEVDLSHVPSVAEAQVPGLDELPQEPQVM
jgi:hypothetical protein